MNILADKVVRVVRRKAEALYGQLFFDTDRTLAAMALRPFELHLELTNWCNADCVFCPYHFQERPKQFMSDEVFQKAVGDFVEAGGGSVGLTPIVGEALIDPKFLNRVHYLRSQPGIDRIFLTTNAILLDRVGVENILTSGVTTLNISTASFDADNYRRIYRSPAYERMRRNVASLVKENARLGNPVNISIGLRTDRPLVEVMRDPDFQAILEYRPAVDFTWSFTSAGGRVTRETLPAAMKLRVAPPKKEPCVSLYNGPIVLPDGDVLACSCVAAMDAVPDLLIGNVLREKLLDIYAGTRLQEIRKQFSPTGEPLNDTCSTCEMYRDLELYRTKEGRTRAELNVRRHSGERISRPDTAAHIFQGG